MMLDTPPAGEQNFAFVMNVGRLVEACSYELAPGHELRRAAPNEVEAIKERLKNLTASWPLSPFRLWEQQLSDASDPEVLSEENWRYHVIGFRGNNQTVVALSHAFNLTRLELEVGFTVLVRDPLQGTIWHSGRLFQVLETAKFGDGASFFVDISPADVDEIRAIHSHLHRHERALLNVETLAAQLGQLKEFPHSSPLRFLGYFAILESILTHAPKPSDPYDSITRQVKKKLALLDRRFSRKIDYARFGGVSSEKIWTKMYAYRSRLAHGGNPQFTNEFAALGNHDAALMLIKETVKSVIRQALSEPQLLIDLREC